MKMNVLPVQDFADQFSYYQLFVMAHRIKE